jgi:chromosome segregation ATPase
VTSEGRGNDDERRVEELLRINAELAAEIRSLTLGRTSAPRSGAPQAARRVSRLQDERDSLERERDSLAAELEATRAEIDRLSGHRDGLALQVRDQAQHLDALSHEVNRLRGGAAGVLRRIRARLLLRG